MKATDNSRLAAKGSGKCDASKFFTTRSAAFPLLAFAFVMLVCAAQGQGCQVTAGEISGPTNTCDFMTSSGGTATYTIAAINAAGFRWTIPAQTTLVSGQGTNEVVVRFKRVFVTGAIGVEIFPSCGEDSIAREIVVGKSLPAPASIQGPSIVCELRGTGVPATYSVDPVPNAAGYTWTVSPRMTIISGQGTPTIQVVFTSAFRAGTVKARAIAGCGPGPIIGLPVSARSTPLPSPIAGLTNGICPETNVEYSVDPDPSAKTYDWQSTVPGATITNHGNSAIIKFPPFTAGKVTVRAGGGCGTSGIRQLTVASQLMATGVVNGPDTVCIGTVQTFSADSILGVTRYDWSLPNGSSLVSGAGSHVITVLVGGESGAIGVLASTECESHELPSHQLTIEQCAEEPPACQIDVYPVPTSGTLHVRFKASAKGSYQIHITDAMTGACKFNTSGTYSEGKNELCLDLSGLQNGSYIFHIGTDEFDHSTRIEIKKGC